ncbi:NAD-dependent epimerase/dehydratase family protein [Tsukamurella asaccharolytica]|uniref:NAD-dependent epimerase/dehydratase family protein n=1 Tax=Tsukamurella asaccharolytica TaxID=2592067 RepID=A0A5C5R6S9_9ACTN|nr:NAD(P)H-binding protein [Tsukamurella asaccharolytica]TWS18917.1 NAD-dependent epimerase/dehydratase family protein [Tsukamurella asaccharolytica]
MRIAVFGASGYSGGHITAEALGRGIEVVGIARDATKVPAGAAAEAGDVTDPDFVARVVDGAAVVVSALPTAAPSGDGADLPTALENLVDAVRATGARLGVVGGAGSLLVAEGGPKLVDTPSFPDAVRPIAQEHDRALDYLRTVDDVDWFYLSPAANYGSFNPGEKRGTFRTGGDLLLTDAEGKSEISGADYAIAFVDEVLTPVHERERFSVAY